MKFYESHFPFANTSTGALESATNGPSLPAVSIDIPLHYESGNDTINDTPTVDNAHRENTPNEALPGEVLVTPDSGSSPSQQSLYIDLPNISNEVLQEEIQHESSHE